MKTWFRKQYVRFLYTLFLWSGTKLFDYVCVYAPTQPGDEPGNETVKALHFADSEEDCLDSAKEMIFDSHIDSNSEQPESESSGA